MVDQVSHRIVLTAALFRDMVPWQECWQMTLGILVDGVRDITIKASREYWPQN